MIRNYLYVALRNIGKYKAFSFINILGLSVGIACCITIFLYVQDELSYDKFNKNADQIYRVALHLRINNNEDKSALSPSPMGAALLHDFPEVKAYTRMRNFGSPVFRYNNKAFSENNVLWADSTFFKVFTARSMAGNLNTALTQPNSIVITKAMAVKYFGKENPLGKILNADHSRDYTVTGVIDDFPLNSHMKFDFLASLTTYADSRNPFWLSNNYYTYFLLKKGTDPAAFQKKINEDAKKYMGPQLFTSVGFTLAQFESRGNKLEYFLQPLTSIHLNSQLGHEMKPNSDISYVYIFSIIALSILLIACINFMNLATARSERRAKEVGIRKTLGSNRFQLIRQFIIESVLMCFIAVVIAVMIAEIILPMFNELSGKELALNLFDNLYTVPALVLIVILVGALAGSYPAFYLSSFQPIYILKKDSRKSGSRSYIRNGLVIFQFAVSIMLFIGTIIIHSQLNYIQNKNLGFNKDQIVVIKKSDDIGNNIEAFKQALLNNSKIISVANSDIVPGSQGGDSVYKIEGSSNETMKDLKNLYCDYGFGDTYRLKITNGRFFSKEHPADTMAVVLNKAAVKQFGIENPVGRNLVSFGETASLYRYYKIIGIVDDFNFESLHQEIRPLVMHLFNRGGYGSLTTVRIAGGDFTSTMEYIESTWKKFADNEAIEFSFFDQDWAHLYEAEQVTSKIATIFSILAILIACLGLLGLAAFITEQRTKEIGIRKVLGASVLEIIILLSKEFTKWVIIANIIAWPVAYFIMNNWLKDFAYRINITVWTFLLSGVVALIIALITVSTHAIKAATANPVKSLKYE